MPSESQIPIASQGRIEAIRDAAGAVLRRDLRHHGHPSAVFHAVAEVGRHRRVLDRDHLRGPGGDAVYGASVRDRGWREALFAAHDPDRDRDRDRARLCRDRHAIFAAGGAARLCRDLLPVDPDGAADGRLCARRRGALWPELRTVAAVGLGGLRGRRAGLRPAGRYRRDPAPDLGHCVGGRARRRCEPRAAAAGPAKAACGRRPWRQAPCCAIPASSPSSLPRR